MKTKALSIFFIGNSHWIDKGGSTKLTDDTLKAIGNIL